MPVNKDVESLAAYDYQDLTVADSSVGVDNTKTLATPHARQIEVFVEDAQIRYRKDGTAPTSSVGEILNPFDRLTLNSLNDIDNFRAIRTGSTSATLRVHFRR